MAKQVKRRRGTASEHAVFTSGAHGELTVSLPDSPVSASEKAATPAEIYVHYGDSAVGERFLSRSATIDLIREQFDRQTFLARITGYTAMNTSDPDMAADSKTNENRWMYEWEEVAVHTPIAHQVKLTFTFGSGTWSSDDITTTFKLPVALYGTNAGTNQAVNNASTSPAYDMDLVDFSLKVNHGLDGQAIDASTITTFLNNWASGWNGVAQSSSTATGVGAISSGTSTIRFHTATVETSTNSVILTRDVAENVTIPNADYSSSGLAVSGGSNISGISMTVISGKYDPKFDVNGDWTGALPTLDGLFMQYGATTQTPAINSTLARTWKSVDPSDGGSSSGYFYALNTAEMNNFYAESTSAAAATDGYGMMGAGMSLTDTNNVNDDHDDDTIIEVVSPKTSSTTSTSKVYAKRQFPQNYGIDPISPGTVVVMHERWTASSSGESNYAGLFPPGGRSVGTNYQGSAVGTSPSTGDASSGNKYTPAPPYYYFSMPNVTQGACG